MQNYVIVIFVGMVMLGGSLYFLPGDSAKPHKCSETVSISGMCQAYFARYYYSAESNTCKITSGSGCSAEGGFSTASDCIRTCGDNETTAEENPLAPQEPRSYNN